MMVGVDGRSNALSNSDKVPILGGGDAAGPRARRHET
jgi:hypothetical protein